MANLTIRDINGNTVTITPSKTVNVGGSIYIIDSNHNLWVRGDNRYGILGAGLDVKEINNANSAAIIAEQNKKKEELKNNLKILVNLAAVQYNNAQSNNLTYLSTISSYIAAGDAYTTSINNAKTELDNLMNDNSASSNAILNSVTVGSTTKSYSNWKSSANTYYTTQQNAYNTLKNTYTTNGNNLAKLSYDTVNNTGTNKKYISNINTANTNCATYLNNINTALNSMAKYDNTYTTNSTITYNSQAKTPANWKTYINNYYNTTLTEANNYKTNSIDTIGKNIATMAYTIKNQTTASSPDSSAIRTNYTTMKNNQTTYNNNINTYKSTYGYNISNTTYTYNNSSLNLTKTVSDWVTWTGNLSFTTTTITNSAKLTDLRTDLSPYIPYFNDSTSGASMYIPLIGTQFHQWYRSAIQDDYINESYIDVYPINTLKKLYYMCLVKSKSDSLWYESRAFYNAENGIMPIDNENVVLSMQEPIKIKISDLNQMIGSDITNYMKDQSSGFKIMGSHEVTDAVLCLGAVSLYIVTPGSHYSSGGYTSNSNYKGHDIKTIHLHLVKSTSYVVSNLIRENLTSSTNVTANPNGHIVLSQSYTSDCYIVNYNTLKIYLTHPITAFKSATIKIFGPNSDHNSTINIDVTTTMSSNGSSNTIITAEWDNTSISNDLEMYYIQLSCPINTEKFSFTSVKIAKAELSLT